MLIKHFHFGGAFLFAKITKGTDDLVIRFYRNTEVINVNQFINSIRDIRALIHNSRIKSKV